MGTVKELLEDIQATEDAISEEKATVDDLKRELDLNGYRFTEEEYAKKEKHYNKSKKTLTELQQILEKSIQDYEASAGQKYEGYGGGKKRNRGSKRRGSKRKGRKSRRTRRR